MSIKTRKIGIIGAGNVGSHLALQFAVQGLADEVVFYDTNMDKAIGESLDLLDAVSYQPHHFEAYAGTMDDMKDADILINASGKPRKQGQNRLDMMDGAIATSKEFLPLIQKSGFDGIIISISNPCDIIAEYLQYKLDWPKKKNHRLRHSPGLCPPADAAFYPAQSQPPLSYRLPSGRTRRFQHDSLEPCQSGRQAHR